MRQRAKGANIAPCAQAQNEPGRGTQDSGKAKAGEGRGRAATLKSTMPLSWLREKTMQDRRPSAKRPQNGRK